MWKNAFKEGSTERKRKSRTLKWKEKKKSLNNEFLYFLFSLLYIAPSYECSVNNSVNENFIQNFFF